MVCSISTFKKVPKRLTYILKASNSQSQFTGNNIIDLTKDEPVEVIDLTQDNERGTNSRERTLPTQSRPHSFVSLTSNVGNGNQAQHTQQATGGQNTGRMASGPPAGVWRIPVPSGGRWPVAAGNPYPRSTSAQQVGVECFWHTVWGYWVGLRHGHAVRYEGSTPEELDECTLASAITDPRPVQYPTIPLTH
jgi:hypothetical protein